MGLLDQRMGYEEAPEKKKKKEKPVNTIYTTDINDIIDNSYPQTNSINDDTNDDDILSRVGKNKKQPANDIDEVDDFSANMFGNNLNSRKEKPLSSPVQTLGNTAESEEEFFKSSLETAREEEEQVRKDKKRTRIISIIMVTLCVYVIFLIYGVFVTDYQYNDKGEIAPVVLSVSEIKELKNYNTMLGQYEKCRVLYEKVLQLDYRLGLGVEDPLTLAPEYEKLLDEVNDLTVKTDALNVDTKYATLKNMMLTWVKTDTAVYLQKIGSGISQNNAEDASVALEYKNIMYNDFSLITQNMITIGDGVNGANTTNIKNWSPEGYIDEFINGKPMDVQQDGPAEEKPQQPTAPEGTTEY